MDMQVMKATATIESLNGVMDAIWRLRKMTGSSSGLAEGLSDEQSFAEELDRGPYCKRGQSIHLWFRGQTNANYPLAPGAFRIRQIGEQKPDVYYEETSAAFHFMLRRPEYRSLCATDFEWLALFQHYGGYTRLLDWTENAAIAAFFAVERNAEDDNEAGSLYVLNAASLNELSCLIADDIPKGSTSVPSEELRPGICVDTSPDVILRSAQAFCRTASEWRSRVESVLRSGFHADLRWLAAALDLLDEHAAASSATAQPAERRELAERFHEKLAYPVAVFPRRSNARLVAQAGMFTLHGGKGKAEMRRGGDPMASPKPSEELAVGQGGRWLLRYEIPVAAKQTIRDQLQAIGIHRATLFPEVQSDGEIMRELWCR